MFGIAYRLMVESRMPSATVHTLVYGTFVNHAGDPQASVVWDGDLISVFRGHGSYAI